MTLAEERSPVTVVGAGNWVWPDDRVGLELLEELEGRYGAEVELCSVGSTGLALLDHLHSQDLLVVVDACNLGGAPGEVRVIEPGLDAGPEQAAAGIMSAHQIGPVETLIIARSLFPSLLPKRILLLLVETVGIDESLLRAAYQRVASVLDNEIQAWYRSSCQGPARLLPDQRTNQPWPNTAGNRGGEHEQK